MCGLQGLSQKRSWASLASYFVFWELGAIQIERSMSKSALAYDQNTVVEFVNETILQVARVQMLFLPCLGIQSRFFIVI